MKDFFKKLNSIFNKKEKFNLIIYLSLSLFTPIIEAVGIGSIAALIMFFFDQLSSEKKIYLEKIGLDSEGIFFLNSINNVLLLVVLIFLFRGVYLFFFHYYETKLRNMLVGEKSKLIYEKFMNFTYLEMKNSSKSEVFNSSVLEVARVIDYIFGIITISRETIMIFILFGSLFFFNSLYTIILTSSLIIFSLTFLFIYNKKLYSVGEELINLQKEMLNIINESVSSFKIISLLNKKNFFLKNFFLATDTRKNNLFYQQFIKKLPKVIFETFIIILISLIIIVFYSDESISETLSFLAILGLISSRIIPSFTTLNVLFSTIKFNEASLNNYYKKFFYKKIIKNKYNKKDLPELIENVNSINIRNLTFSYNKIKILEAVNLDIYKSKIYGIFGRSGSGKSTLVDIIAGLIDPDKGQIFYNKDNEIHENISAWQSSLGYVSQDALLINDSIKKNICLGIDEDKINYSKLENIINLIGMNKFYKDYDNNMDFKIGEGGSRISGGQKQRISIARTLYFNPKIIIFDEATSSLDQQSEQQILNLIVKLKNDHIIIVISHNEKIKKICDDFVDLDSINKQND